MPKKIDGEAWMAEIELMGFRCLEKITHSNGRYLFLCAVCKSREFRTVAGRIRSGHTKSCGCIKGRKRRIGTEHVTGEYFGTVKKNAESAGRVFSVTIEFLTELLIKQDFKCALSDMPISLHYRSRFRDPITGTCKTFLSKSQLGNTASLDRIDNTKGYSEDNVQWVHRDVNFMKQEFTQRRFISVCKMITEKMRKCLLI